MSLLATKQLKKYFGDTHAVDGVDFSVRPGEVLALIGANGAGKTTLVNVISGLLRPDDGTILFQGADVTHQSIHDRIKAGIARSFQLVNLFDQLTCLDNVALAIFSREGKTQRLMALADQDRAVREEAMTMLQHRFTARQAVVLEGRDAGTVVFPDADVKFFLTASVEERAKRRLAELEATGADAPSFEEVKRQITARDEGDSTRKVAPLKMAPDAIEVDTSHMTLDQVVKYMEALARQRLGIK